MKFKDLYSNAKIATWRRHRYRTLGDVPRDFLLRSAVQLCAKSGRPPISLALTLWPRGLNQPVYLRAGTSDFQVFHDIFDRQDYAPVKNWPIAADARILDLGANIGMASLYFAALYPQSRLLAIEPEAANAALLKRNCQRLINDGRMSVLRAFAAAEDGQAGIARDVPAWAVHKVDAPINGSARIRCLSMPNLLRLAGFETVDLLKCDIEGSEREIFKTCGQWIKRVRQLIVETHRPYTLDALFEDLRGAGYRFEILTQLQEDYVGLAFVKQLSH